MIAYGSGFIVIPKRWQSFKAIVASKTLSIQYEENDNTYQIFAIDDAILYETIIYKGLLPSTILQAYSQEQNDADKADFENNYAILANKPLAPKDPASGSTVVTMVEGGTINPRTEVWAADDESVTTDWETLWSKTGTGIFWQTLFQLNSDDFDFRVAVDGATLFTLSLDELKNDYDLVESDEFVWDLHQYKSNKWRYKPISPIRFTSEIKLEFRSQSGTKKVVRGMSNWGPA